VIGKPLQPNLCTLSGSSPKQNYKEDADIRFRQITGHCESEFVPNSSSNPEYDFGSFFLSLTYPDYSEVSAETMTKLSLGVQALEV
jgi:hypothetical protein